MIQSNLDKEIIFSSNIQNAITVGKAAFHKISKGNLTPPIPLYLKKSSAEILMEEKTNGNSNN